MSENELKLYYNWVGNFIASHGDFERKFGKIDIRTIVKELGQNSLDAKLNKTSPVELEIKLVQIPANIKNSYFQKIGLKDMTMLCENLRYMSKCDDNEKERYLKMLSSLKDQDKDVFFLVVSDYDTYGLTGSDIFNPNVQSRFQSYNYILGMSQKSSDLGSYGEGRLAALSMSEIQYVYELSHLSDKWEDKIFRIFGLGIQGIFQKDSRTYDGVFFSCRLEDDDLVRSLMKENIDDECIIIPKKRKEKTGTTFVFPIVDIELLLQNQLSEQEDESSKEKIFLSEIRKYTIEIFFPAIANRILTLRTLSSEIVQEKEKIKHSTNIGSDDLSEIYKILAYNISDSEASELEIKLPNYVKNFFQEDVILQIPQGQFTPRKIEKLKMNLIEIDEDKLHPKLQQNLNPLMNKLTLARNGMVIEHKDFRIPLTKNFIGLLNVTKEDNTPAHEFLRCCEPVKHNIWTNTPRLRSDYGKTSGPSQLRLFFRNLFEIIREHFGYIETITDMLSEDIREEIFEGLGIQDFVLRTEIKDPVKRAKTKHEIYREKGKRIASMEIGEGFIISPPEGTEIELKSANGKPKPSVRTKSPVKTTKTRKKKSKIKKAESDKYQFYLIPKLEERTESYLKVKLFLPEGEKQVRNISIKPEVTSYDKALRIPLDWDYIINNKRKSIDLHKTIPEEDFPLEIQIDINSIPARIRENVKIEFSILGER